MNQKIRHLLLFWAILLPLFAWSQNKPKTDPIKLDFNPVINNSGKSNGLWKEVSENQIPKVGTRYITPRKYRTMKLDLNQIREILNVAPMEFTPVAQMTKTFLELPMPDGSIKSFDIVESPIMDPELAARYPEIGTYAGYAVDNKSIYVRLDLTPQGFHAMVMIPGESTVFIDPYSFGGGDIENYIIYNKSDFASSVPKFFECGVTETFKSGIGQNPDLKSAYGSCELRTYRLALAATGEYTAFHGGTVALALAAMNTTMNRINGVYEREMAIRMNIIANNNTIIYTNAGSDPYTNTDGAAMLNQNQTNITNLIGSANYDIGHVFSTGGGGIAQLGSVCVASGKARGVTGSSSPVGDPFDIDYVAHEMGHQFGCNHTFNNSDDGSCNGNTNGTTSMEPGSGTTIMAYAGICNPSNVQNNSDDYFHTISLQEMGAFITGGGHTCPVKTTLSNGNPAVTANTPTIVVPQGTPFFLTATGTDPNPSNTLTYCWEQTNTGNATTSPSATATSGANFRSFDPTTNPTRFFPNLTSLAANGPFTWEVLPTVTRTMSFRVTIRDNAPGGGCTAIANSTVSVTNTSGPFSVTVPSNTGISYVGATTQTVTWNVAGTTGAPVSCANVDILISTNGGLTYTVLIANTPNDGSQAVTMPNTPSTTCRIQVRCAGGNFFDISNNNFTITAATFDYTLSVSNPTVSVCQPTNAVYNIISTSIGGYSTGITLSLTGLPAGGIATFGTNPLTPSNSTTLTISGIGSVAPGTYNMTLTGTSTSGTKTVSLVLNVSSGAPAAVTLTTPTNGATAVAMPVNFSWSAAAGTGVTYAIQISTSATFTPIVDNASGLTLNSYNSIALSPSTQYFWRVTASNGCGSAPASSTFNFTTGLAGCDTITNYLNTHTAAVYSAGAGLGYVSGQNTYGDLAKADKFTYTGSNTHIRGAFIGFGRSFASNATNTFFVRVWDGTTGSPTTVLATTPVTYQAVQNLIAGGSNVGFINFGSIPLPASKIFFVGIEFTYGADTIALITNTNGQTTPATAWEKFGNGTWVSYDDPTSWPLSVAHFIRPVLGIPTDANFTPLTPVVCAGNSITLTNTSTGATTYSWSFASGSPATSTVTNPSVSYATPGTYSISLIANNACMTDTVTRNITVNAVTVTIGSTNVSCNGGSNGTATATSAGGTAPYTYLWSNGRTTTSNTGLVAGTYTVTATDAGGCTKSSSVTITQPTAVSATVTNTNVTCNGGTNGSLVVTAIGGTAPYTYAWNNGRTSATNTGLAAGTYTVTVTSTGGCTITRSGTVTQPSAVTATLFSVSVTCNGGNTGSANVTASGGTAPYTYLWSNGRTTASNTGLTAGVYTITVSDANICRSISTVSISQPSAITVSTTTNNPLCNGSNTGSIAVTATGGVSPYTFVWSNGRTTQNNTGLTAGNYVVTVTTANGCSTTSTVTLTQPTLLQSTFNVTNVSCNGGNNGSVLVVATGGTPGYQYLWSNGRNTSSNTGLAAGVYTVTITDINGCTTSSSATVTQPNPFTATATATNVNCNGGNTGSVSVTVSGGTAPFTYLWNNGRTTSTVTGLTAGNYSVTVTSSGGCTAITSATVTQPSSSVGATITSSINATCNGSATGSLTAAGSGGVSPYSYIWNNGRTTAQNQNLIAGIYTVTVSDANNCSTVITGQVNQPTQILITGTIVPESCTGNDGAINISVSGGVVPYFFQWSNGRTTEDITGLTIGTYNLTVIDINNCTQPAVFNVGTSCIVCNLSASATNTNVQCFGANNGVATVVPAGGTSPFTYLWSNSRTTASISGLVAGNYSVTVTDINNCTATASVTVTSPAQITAFITPNSTNVSCNGGSNGTLVTNVTGGVSPYTYQWSNGRNTSVITGLTAGIYTLTITDNNGCVLVITGQVTQPSAISVSTSSTPQSCTPGSGQASVTASGGTGSLVFNWSNGATTNVVNGLNSGTYTVTVSDVNNCSSVATVIVGNTCCNLSGSATNVNVSCNGGSNGSATAVPAGGTAPVSFLWSNGQTTSTINNLAAGIYTVTFTDVTACTAIATVTITQPSSVLNGLISPNSTNVSCNGGNNGTLVATAFGGTAPYNLLWSNGNTTSVNSGLSAGIYTLTITDAGGCFIVITGQITQPSSIAVSTTSIPQDCTPGSGQVAATASGGTGALTYTWNFGANTNVVNGMNAGNYTVTVTDVNGCSAIASVNVALNCVSCTLSGSATNVNVSCFGANNGAAVAVSAGGTNPISYLWNNGSTSININNLVAGVYSVTMTDASGCTASASVTVTQPSSPLVTTIAPIVNVSCFGLSNGSMTAVSIGGVPPYTFNWSNGATTSTISGLSAGTYVVTVRDANGCVNVFTGVINQPTQLTATGSVTQPSSAISTDGSIALTVNGGTSQYTFNWSNGANTPQLGNIGIGTYTVTITDANGCTLVQTFSVSQATAVEGIENISNFIVVPNPSAGQFTIQIDLNTAESLTVELVDVLGRNLRKWNFSNENQIRVPVDISEQAGGMYFVVLRMENGSLKTHKISVTK